MSLRAVTFIDYYSIYNDARDLFRPTGDEQRHGHFDPWELSSRICDAHNERFAGEQPLEFGGVHVYYATPPRRGRAAHAASARIRQWRQKHPEIGVFSHPLQLVADTEREIEIKKLIHTTLAVELVAAWKRSEFEVAILASSDEESRTVAQKVRDEASQDPFRLDVAGWVATAPGGRPIERRILYLGGQEPRQHLLTEEIYRAVAEREPRRRRRRLNQTRAARSRDHARPNM